MVSVKLQKILLVRTDRIGELVLSLPVVRALKEKHPASSVSILAQRKFAEYLRHFSAIDEVLEWPYGITRLNLTEKLRMAHFLRKKRFDLVIILNPSKELNQIVCLAGIKYRLGYERKWSFLLNIKILDEKFRGEKHEVEYNFDLLRKINIEPEHKGFPENDFNRDTSIKL